jgi:hypothetical protein
MTKTQKIWLGIFLAMFVVPEALWSPILGLFPFNAYLRSSDYHATLTVIVFVEFLGLFLSTIMVFRFAKYHWKNIVGIFLLGLSGWAFYIFYLLYATIHFWR